MNCADWRFKDVLTHLLDWEMRTCDCCLAGLDGETPDVPGDGFKWNQTKQLNGLIQERHSRKSIRKILEEFDQTHERTLARLSQKELTSLNHIDWPGNSWTVSDYLLANTANHYRWARNKIRKWLVSLES